MRRRRTTIGVNLKTRQEQKMCRFKYSSELDTCMAIDRAIDRELALTDQKPPQLPLCDAAADSPVA